MSARELIRDGDLVVRPMRDDSADYEQMAKWLADQRVLEFYEGRDQLFPLARILAEHSPRVLHPEGVTPCFLLLEGAPIGYLQFYAVLSDEDRESYGLGAEKSGRIIFGMDQFIGEPDYWNHAIGTRAVGLMLRYLFDVQHAESVVVDPHADNPRAIRCYEKCGFRKIKLLPGHELHEGRRKDCWLMRAP